MQQLLKITSPDGGLVDINKDITDEGKNDTIDADAAEYNSNSIDSGH